MKDPFLVDECLSPDLVALANARGHHATHVVFRGWQGVSDPDLMPHIMDEGFILVTNNGRDFLKLYSRKEVHPGLIIIVPGGLIRAAQIDFFGLVLDVVETHDDLVNKVVEVFSDGRVEMRDMPNRGSTNRDGSGRN